MTFLFIKTLKSTQECSLTSDGGTAHPLYIAGELVMAEERMLEKSSHRNAPGLIRIGYSASIACPLSTLVVKEFLKIISGS